MAQEIKIDIYAMLMRDARYALRSESRDLVYRVIGERDMAYILAQITFDQYMKLNDMLVRDGLNNPSKSHLH